MVKSARESNKLLRTWLFVKSASSRFSLLRLAIFCLLPLLITGFIFFQWSIPSSQQRFTKSNIKDFMEIAGAEIALVALLLTAFSVNSEYQRQKKLRSSALIEQWHGDGMETCIRGTRLLKTLLRKNNIRLQETATELEKIQENLSRDKNNQQILEKKDGLLKERADFFNAVEEIFIDINEEKAIKEIIEHSSEREEENKIPLRDSLNKLLNFFEHLGQEENKIPLRDSLNKLLNFFEHMGQEVKFGVADESFLRDFFYYIVIQHYEDLRCILNIARWRKAKQNPEYLLLFANFEYLALRWMQQGPPPTPYKRFGHILAKSRRSARSFIWANSKLEIQRTPQKTDFEELIMESLLDGDDPILATLRDQYYCHSNIQSREESGAGFFLNFKVENSAIVKPENLQIDDVYFDLEGVSFGGRAVLFIRGGILSYLEVYLHTDEWIKNSKIIAIYYDSGKVRNLKKQSEKWRKNYCES